MCGITGFWCDCELNRQSAEILSTMMETLHHRGPDGASTHIDNKQGLAMGHTRLSIIDLNTGEQPLVSRQNNLILTVNGEFYNYKRIRADLVLGGSKFKTKSDSEIVFDLYNKYGLDFVDHLRGEFAFTLFDMDKQRLIMVRDRFGIKPLYYHYDGTTIYYGSEIKALFANPNVPREFSAEGLLHQLMHTMVPGSTTYKGIEAIKPGNMIVVEKKAKGFNIKDHCYWDMNFPHNKDRAKDKDENYYIEEVRDKLAESVHLRLEADVPVGCYLSGGIDSCSILGLAGSIQQSPVKAYTISFDHDDYDESEIATLMAKSVNADQEILYLKAQDLYGQNYIDTLWHAERTFYNTLGVAKFCMSRRVKESGYKVVITGEGSDELFGGYPAFKRDMFYYSTDSESHDIKQMQSALDSSNEIFKGAIISEQRVSHSSFDKVCGFTPSWIQPWMLTLQIAKPLLHDDLLSDLKDYDPIENIANSINPDQVSGRHPLDIAQYTWSKTMLECQILNWGGDRVDMANSMESRPAFLDHHVAEAAVNIPPELRIKGNTEKWVLREAMKNVLPEVLYKREKFAFMAPPGHTEVGKKKALNDLVDGYMNKDRIKNAGIFDEGRLSQFIDGYYDDDDNVSMVRKDALMNHILGLHILHDHFIAN